jgi:hypothetical protein
MPSEAAVDATTRLEWIDRLATILIARAPAVRFDLARATEERTAIFRLRYEVVIERGWVSADTMPTGLEQDADDDQAVLIGGWDGERLVAAGRVLFPTPDRGLPVERIFDLKVEPHDHVAHVDRLCVARTHREPSHRVFGALTGRCWQELRTYGFTACCGIDSAAMVRVFRRVGLTLTPLGPPRRYWGELRSPMLFDPSTLSAPEPPSRAPRPGESAAAAVT